MTPPQLSLKGARQNAQQNPQLCAARLRGASRFTALSLCFVALACSRASGPSEGPASGAPVSAASSAPEGPVAQPRAARVTLPSDELKDEPLSEPITDAPDAGRSREGHELGTIGGVSGGGELAGVGYGHVGHGGGGVARGGRVSGSSAPRKPAPRSAAAARPPGGAIPGQAQGIRAGEWDDNANYRDYLSYQAQTPEKTRLNVAARRFLVVRDAASKPIPNCAVQVTDPSTKQSVTLTTTASGRALLFPRAFGLSGAQLRATASCLGVQRSAEFSAVEPDGAVLLELPIIRQLPARQVFDVAFVLDTTGSMREEINAMKGTLEQVAELISKLNITARVGLVEYRDRGDAYLTRTHPMTTDVRGFSQRVSHITASGGGDLPEHVNEGLRVALDKLSLSERSLGRLVFLIGDAPPQLSYEQDTPFTVSTQRAAERGIQLYTIAASGMNDLGQAAWRQMAMFTGGTNLFILRGGAGPQSVGGGDPIDSCGTRHTNYSTGNLAELITDKLRLAVQQLEQDPLRIAGLGQDENTKPCDQRVQLIASP